MPRQSAVWDRLTDEPWWICLCGRQMSEHSRRKVPNAGIEEYVCTLTPRGRFTPITFPQLDYTPERGLHAPR